MNKVKIWGTSFSLIGDLIMSLPQLTYFKKKYPSSYIYFVIHKKIAYCAPLFLNHPLIDNIRISQEWSGFGDEDYKIASSCDILTTPLNKEKKILCNRAHYDREDWYNIRNCIVENSLMSGIDDIENILSKEELFPKLEMWFDPGFVSFQKKGAYTYDKVENKLNKKLNKYISVWPFAGYGRSNDRSPSQDWWTNVVKSLVDQKINIIHCGYINEPDLSNNTKYYKKITNMDFFEQIKISLGTSLAIGTDSGSMWVLGAYSHPSIHLMTNWANFSQKHKTNFTAFEPLNSNSITFFEHDGCDNINKDEVIQTCVKMLDEKKTNFNKFLDKFI